MARASLWDGHSQASRSALPLTTSCEFGLLRGAQCRQSAGVLSSAASACPQPRAARGWMSYGHSKPVGRSQPGQQVSSASDHVMRAHSPLGCRNTQVLIWLGQSC